MTAFEIAETLINGNISDAREAIREAADPVVTALEVLIAMTDDVESISQARRLVRCLQRGW